MPVYRMSSNQICNFLQATAPTLLRKRYNRINSGAHCYTLGWRQGLSLHIRKIDPSTARCQTISLQAQEPLSERTKHKVGYYVRRALSMVTIPHNLRVTPTVNKCSCDTKFIMRRACKECVDTTNVNEEDDYESTCSATNICPTPLISL